MVFINRPMPLIPTNMTQLIDLLKDNGYRQLKRQSGVQVRVLIDGTTAERIRVCEILEGQFEDIGARYMDNHNDSSIGAVLINNMRINVKPLKRQGSGSAGVENEHFCVDTINDMVKEIGNPEGIRVQFKQQGSSRRKTYKNIVSVKQVGGDTKGRKKADILVTNKSGISYPISIKKDGYEMLESADSYYTGKARKKFDRLMKEGKVELEFLKEKRGRQGKYNVWKVAPNFAIKATPQEKKDVVFGSDIITKKGAVVVRTFRGSDFKYDGKKNLLVINCTEVIYEMSHAKAVWFLVRNDETRNASSRYPKSREIPAGIRVIAYIDGKRVNSRSVLKVR